MSDNKSIVLPMFNGKDEAFQVWWTKFRAFATAKGFVATLLEKETELPSNESVALDPTKDADKPKIKAKERNSLGMAYLLQAFKAEADISLAYETMDNDWPGGLAYLTVEKLMAIYKPKDNVTEVEVYTKLLQVKMKKKEDPKVLFEQVASIQNWYNTDKKKLPKEQLIAVVLRAAPKEYASVLTGEQAKQGTKLELSHLRAVMNTYYRTVYKQSDKSEEDDELALAGSDGKQHNHNHGKDGKKQKFQGNCNECGKKGHKARDCWLNPQNKDKRPKWWDENKHGRKATEVTAGSADNTKKKSNELQLVNMSWGEYEEAFASDDENESILAEDDTKWMEDEIVAIQAARKTETRTETMLRAAVETGSGIKLLEDPEIFVCDTGATTHSTGHGFGLIDLKDGGGRTTKVGNGASVTTKAVGVLPFKTKEGTTGNMNGIHYIKGAPFNLISGTKLLDLGYKLQGDKDKIWYTKDGTKLVFDIKIETPEGMLFATRLQRTATEVGGAVAQEKTVSIKVAHELLGHMDEAATRKAAANLGWTITRGTLGVCESCAKAKAKQKNVANKEAPKEKAKEVNGRVYLDLSRVVNPNNAKQPRRPNWCLIVDEKTGYKSSSFYESKDGMVEPTCSKFKNWKDNGKEVKIIRMDNAGENKQLVKRLKSKHWQLYPEIEYTARDTPQHNHLVEVGFATLYGRGRALMMEAKVPKDKKHIVAQKAFETATKLDGLIPIEINGVTKPRVEHWSGKIPGFAKHLRTWGEAGVVKIRTKTTPKLEERGITCMMVGYATDHEGDCYEMLNMETNRILLSRDVLWLNRMYFDGVRVCK